MGTDDQSHIHAFLRDKFFNNPFLRNFQFSTSSWQKAGIEERGVGFFWKMHCCFHEIFLILFFFFSMLTGRLKNKMSKMRWLQMKPPKFSYFLACWVPALKWFVDFANEFLEYPSYAPMIKTYYSIQHVWNYLFWGQPTGKQFSNKKIFWRK